MSVLIVYAHPYDKSFNHEVLNRIEKILYQNNMKYSVIDLYKDRFNPVYSSEELSLFKYGKTTDNLVQRYQRALKKADKIIFIFPIWWNETPAIIKGFIDKVMKKEFAYTIGETGVIGNLGNISKGWVLTTSTSPKWYLQLFCGNYIQKVFINSTLSQLSIKNIKWFNLGKIDNLDLTFREKYLDHISSKIKRGIVDKNE